jgi:predicted nucleic acid-binding protein
MKINKAFVDTSVFVSLADGADSNHEKAVFLSEIIAKNNINLYTSSDVIGESLTVISRKLGKIDTGNFYKTYFCGAIKEIFIDQYFHRETRNFFFRVKSKNISFVDCSSVIAMKRNKIDVIFSFDTDFKSMGVKLLGDVV